jgi:hypothetical protein
MEKTLQKALFVMTKMFKNGVLEMVSNGIVVLSVITTL